VDYAPAVRWLLQNSSNMFPHTAQDGPSVAHPTEADDITFLHYPIPDLTAPSDELLRNIVDELERRFRDPNRKGAIYIHCGGGRGRTGTICAALLGRLNPSLTADAALSYVQAAYNARGVHGISPETRDQVRTVQRFFMSSQAPRPRGNLEAEDF